MKGHTSITIVTVDTDVVVISISENLNLSDHGLVEMWVEFGSCVNRKWLSIHSFCFSLGCEKCDAILFWYADTGCDTITAWKPWNVFPQVTSVFRKLSIGQNYTVDDFSKFRRFTCILYKRTSVHDNVNKCRREQNRKYPPHKLCMLSSRSSVASVNCKTAVATINNWLWLDRNW